MSPVSRRAVLRSGALALAVPLVGPLVACASRSATLTDLTDLRSNGATLKWRRRVDDSGVGFVPAMNDGRLWVSDQSGDLSALDPADGTVVQRIATGQYLASGIAARNDRLAVVDADGSLLVYDTAGKRLWTSALNAEPLSVPTIAGGVVLVRLSNGSVVAHDLQSGSRRWLYTQSDPALVLRQTSGIATDAVNAYIGLSNGQLTALSLTTGATLWETRISVPRGANEIERITDVIGTPIVDGATLCAAAYQGRVTCISGNDGQSIWSQDVRAASGLAMGPGRVLVALDVEGRVTAWSARRERLWQQEGLRGRNPAGPAFIGDHWWIGDAGGVAHVLDPLDGRLVGRVAIDRSAIVGPPIPIPVGDQTLAVFQTSAGTVAALGYQ